MNIPTRRLKAFYSNCYQDDESGCWRWTGTKHYSGYGCFRVLGKMWRAHRLSWVIHNGIIPDELCVLHRCDEPECVNPKHLFLGTQKDNLYDCINKGRFRVASGVNHGTKTMPYRIARGSRHGTRTHPESIVRGENHWMKTRPWLIPRGSRRWSSKLSEKDIQRIRKLYSSGSVFQRNIAKEFGVSRQTIGLIVNKKIWTHVS